MPHAWLWFWLLVLTFASSIAACGSDCPQLPGGAPFALTMVTPAPGNAPAGAPVTVALEARDGCGQTVPVADLAFTLAGGGRAERTSPPGSARIEIAWTLGVAPVANRLDVRAPSVPGASVAFETRATLAAPAAPQPFGSVDAFLTGRGIAGSTEDLAFDGAGRLLMGVPGGLIALDATGTASWVPLTGEALVAPLGVAVDRDGNIWLADGQGHALRKVSPAGVVSTVLAAAGGQPLGLPNDVAVGPDGRIYLSDSCRGEVYRVRPEGGAIEATLVLATATEGGPNGLAFDAAGMLWLTTENNRIFCASGPPDATAPVAGLHSVEVTAAGFGARTAVATNLGLFGDGLAFDAEGNLYAIFDTQRSFRIEESAVWVLPRGERQLVKMLAVSDRILANLAFGTGAFGERTLYVALISVPPFTPPSARGVERFDLGIAGLPLLRP